MLSLPLSLLSLAPSITLLQPLLASIITGMLMRDHEELSTRQNDTPGEWALRPLPWLDSAFCLWPADSRKREQRMSRAAVLPVLHGS